MEYAPRSQASPTLTMLQVLFSELRRFGVSNILAGQRQQQPDFHSLVLESRNGGRLCPYTAHWHRSASHRDQVHLPKAVYLLHGRLYRAALILEIGHEVSGQEVYMR